MPVSRNPFRTASVALVVAVALAAPVGAGAPANADLSGITIENFGRINNVYDRGAQPAGQDVGRLAAIGVKSIIDLTDAPGKGAEAREAGLKFFQIPMSSTTPPSCIA